MVVLIKEQTHRPIKQNREVDSCKYSQLIWTMEKRWSSQQMVLGKLDIHMQKKNLGTTLNHN